jgi:hypothetical protein
MILRPARREPPSLLRRFSIRHGRASTLLWHTLAQVVVRNAPVSPVALVARRSETLFFISEDTAEVFGYNGYWSMVMKRLVRQGKPSSTILPVRDHGFLTQVCRTQVQELLTTWILSGFSPAKDLADQQLRTPTPAGEYGELRERSVS